MVLYNAPVQINDSKKLSTKLFYPIPSHLPTSHCDCYSKHQSSNSMSLANNHVEVYDLCTLSTYGECIGMVSCYDQYRVGKVDFLSLECQLLILCFVFLDFTLNQATFYVFDNCVSVVIYYLYPMLY